MPAKGPMKVSSKALVVWLTGALLSLNPSAQAWQESRVPLTPLVSPEDVTVRIVDWDTYRAETGSLAAQQTLEAFWVHGSSLQHNEPIDGSTDLWLQHVPAGCVIYRGVKEAGSVLFAIPTPVITGSTRVKLLRVLIVFSTVSTGEITRIDVTDGKSPILSKEGSWTGAHDELESMLVLEFAEPPTILFGLGTSLNLDHVGVMRFMAAGADFIHQ